MQGPTSVGALSELGKIEKNLNLENLKKMHYIDSSLDI